MEPIHTENVSQQVVREAFHHSYFCHRMPLLGFRFAWCSSRGSCTFWAKDPKWSPDYIIYISSFIMKNRYDMWYTKIWYDHRSVCFSLLKMNVKNTTYCNVPWLLSYELCLKLKTRTLYLKKSSDLENLKGWYRKETFCKVWRWHERF